MVDLVAQVLVIVLALGFFTAFLVTVVLSRRWLKEHGEPEEPPLIDPELTRFGTPFSEIRTRADRLVRDGRAADDPATAYVAHRLAERELPLRENPWRSRGYVLLPMAQAPMIIHQSLTTADSAVFSLGFLAAVLGLTVVFGVLAERHARRRRANVELALELNRALAAEFDRSRSRREEVPE
ncbi:hypothetical protein NE857_31800 [Nocardiopsis exhalans]|uniref:Uncharacterized protein n=1 Tax=Nocardiopsis exhalans TaxID=163604 RepID=A0ABY5D7P1_9ACTN|nr:hypothetical protein [Nocardiopsis exhalans]USY19761.1 hypothetical protein NE857_31800 [Nocardiopsis exhalans]